MATMLVLLGRDLEVYTGVVSELYDIRMFRKIS
jgi:hypothetical protein